MKKLGIMQPYFFPYIGYFQLIESTDHFILFDTPQYERRGWMNRNRIINLQEGSTYITAGTVKAPQKTALNKIMLTEDDGWRNKVLSQLEIYRKLAPNYSQVISLVSELFGRDIQTLADLNYQSIKLVCEYLGIHRKIDIFSQMDLDIPADCSADEWALYITKAMGYSAYVNAPGGESFFDASKYRDAGIELQFIQPKLTPYVQRIGRWEPGLSILDVMMFNSVEEIQQMLKQYDLKRC